jgi:cell division protein FtsW (lipid II flippase)
MFFPTWLVMALLLTAFVWCTFQQYRLQYVHKSMFRMYVSAALVLTMFVAVLYNGTDRWLSTGLFIASVSALLLDVHLYRQWKTMMPPPKKEY